MLFLIAGLTALIAFPIAGILWLLQMDLVCYGIILVWLMLVCLLGQLERN